MRKTFSQVILILIALGILLAIIGSIGAVGLLRIAQTSEPTIGTPQDSSDNTPINAPTPATGIRGAADAVDAIRPGPQDETQRDRPREGVVDQPDTIAAAPPVGPVEPAEPAVGFSKAVAAVAKPVPRIVLEAAAARLHGRAICHLGDRGDIASWTGSDDWIDWSNVSCLKEDQAYYIDLTYSCGPGFGGDFAISIGDAKTMGHSQSTGSWKTFKTERLGKIQVAGGPGTLSLKPMFGMKRNLMLLRRIELIPAGSQAEADADAVPAPSKEKRRAGATDDVILFDINANTPIVSITDGTIIDLASLPDRNVTILAAVSGNPGSVRFEVDGGTSTHVENRSPFVLAGRDLNRMRSWGLSMGEHTLTVTPFDGADATGIAGNSLTVHFKIAWAFHVASY